jgi:hypothetical protein
MEDDGNRSASRQAGNALKRDTPKMRQRPVLISQNRARGNLRM